jgi:hypothetical protein
MLLRLPSELLRSGDDVSNQLTHRVVERSDARGAIAAEQSMLMVASRDSWAAKETTQRKQPRACSKDNASRPGTRVMQMAAKAVIPFAFAEQTRNHFDRQLLPTRERKRVVVTLLGGDG